MKFDKVALFCLLILFLFACSESDKVAGGSIEDQNAVSEERLNEWYSYGTSLQESAYARIDGGKLALAEDGSGARAECTADSTSLAMTFLIQEGFVVSTLNGGHMGVKCDSAYNVFKSECESQAGNEFFTLSNGCKNGSFDGACRLSNVHADSINILFTRFENATVNRCAELSKKAQSSTGRFESLSSYQEPTSSSSSSIDSPIITPTDTSVAVNYHQTLERYVLQYVSSVDELTFDNHVIAYNGSASMECIDFMNSSFDLTDKPILKEIAQTDMAKCFPMTSKLMRDVAYESREKCKYYATFVNDGAQPTGHVLSSVADNEIEFTSISPGGSCMMSMNYFPVYFLFEDCDGEITSMKPTRKNQIFKSEIWKCEEGSYSPSAKAASYGEWFNERLIPEGFKIDTSAIVEMNRGTNSTYRVFKTPKETVYEKLDQNQKGCVVNVYREESSLQQVKTFENGDSYLTVSLRSFVEGQTQPVYSISGVYGGNKGKCAEDREAFLNFCKQAEGFIEHSVAYIGLGCEEDAVLEMHCAANVPETSVDYFVPKLKENCKS